MKDAFRRSEIFMQKKVGAEVKGKLVACGSKADSFLIVGKSVFVFALGLVNVTQKIMDFTCVLNSEGALSRLEACSEVFGLLQPQNSHIVKSVVRAGILDRGLLESIYCLRVCTVRRQHCSLSHMADSRA